MSETSWPDELPPRVPQRDYLIAHLDGWGMREREADATGSACVPRDTVEELRASGLLHGPVPEALGGSANDLVQCAALVRAVAQAAPATALCLAMPLGNAGNTRVPDDAVTGAARAELVAGKAFIARESRRGRILAVANSEPGAQGSLEGTRTRVLCTAEGEQRLSGRKSFATWGSAADYFLCSARDEQDALDAFFVASTAPGVRLDGEWDPLGMRSSESVGITLEDAPAAQRFLHRGAIVGVSARHWSTVLLGAVFVGVGEGALRAARASGVSGSAYAQSTLAESTLALEAAWGFIEAVAFADRYTGERRYAERCQRAKTHAARVAVDVTKNALTLAGGKAYRPQHDLARYLHAALAGPLVRPPLAQAMDAIVKGGYRVHG